MEYKTIVCPIDGTELSEKSLKHAAYISKVSGGKIVLLHVMEKWNRAGHVTTDSSEWETIHKDWLSEGRTVLTNAAETLRDLGASHVDTMLREGDASHEITAIAREVNADLIIMTTHRYSPIGKLFAGSITDNVTRNSPCPVLWIF
ncbi:MAG: universal stress protein [Deltaproteobacteria bacterium]|nr:universal stress protein [Deltaproteobacteria bacterium]